MILIEIFKTLCLICLVLAAAMMIATLCKEYYYRSRQERAIRLGILRLRRDIREALNNRDMREINRYDIRGYYYGLTHNDLIFLLECCDKYEVGERLKTYGSVDDKLINILF